MATELNTFKSISEASPQTFPLVKILLKSFPLTKACMDTLGSRLFEALEFGFFGPEVKLISQGETGNDLFLICTHKVEIIVDGESVLQMPAPELFGDKGLIEKSSTRSATVEISNGGTCFVLKLPIGIFIHPFGDSKILDHKFSQEAQIFHKIFQIIQKRLFKYIHLQKQVWEEVSTTLDLLNAQLIANGIKGNKERVWEHSVKTAIIKYFKRKLKYDWPDHIEINNVAIFQVFQLILKKHLKAHPGKTSSYQQKILKQWINELAPLILKHLPKEQHPVSIGEIEMFNPKNYQLRIQRYLVKIEDKFKRKKSQHEDEDYAQLKFKNFFQSNIDANTFELQQYLETFIEVFPVKSPNRTFANIAQQVATITAQAENEFNKSISRMHHFLKKAHQLVSPQKEKNISPAFLNRFQTRYATLISNAINADQVYQKYSSQVLSRNKTVDLSKTPTLKALLENGSSQVIRDSLQEAISQITLNFNLKETGLSGEQLYHFFNVIEIPLQRKFSGKTFLNYCIIPLTENLSLSNGIEEYPPLQPGTLLGDIFFRPAATKSEDSSTWSLTATASAKEGRRGKSALALLFHLPVEVNQQAHTPPFFPFQWMINQFLSQIHTLYQSCKGGQKKLSKVIEAEFLERQVKQFEQDTQALEIYKYGLLLDSIQNMTGIKLPFKTTISPSAFSKQLYNAIVAKTNQENPDLKLEERGNKAYTQWRYLLSRIVTEFPTLKPLEKDNLPSPVRILISLKKHLSKILTHSGVIPEKSILSIGETRSHLDLTKSLDSADPSKTSLQQLGIEIIESIQLHHQMLYSELQTLTKRLDEIGKAGKKVNSEDLRISYINSIISKLQKILLKS